MLIIYTGNGKGKTSASVGQAIRAYGQGMSVAFGQFIKRDEQAGEQKICKQLFGELFMANGEGFFLDEKKRSVHRKACLELLQWVKNLLFIPVDMIILDEALYALKSNLLLEKELEEILFLCKKAHVHLVLSGRGLPDWLKKEADIITEMMEVKHPYPSDGVAIKGIEF